MRCSRAPRALAALALLCLPGCERKAPGPEACRNFAYRVVGVTAARELEVPRVRVRVDEITRSCLVTPYDRELLRCVEVGSSPTLCMRAFNARDAKRQL